MNLRNQLELLLANYEMDEPHTGNPAFTGGKTYGNLTIYDINRMAARPHDGDCVKQSGPCMRCMADHWKHKAKWILDRLDFAPKND